MAWRRLGAKGDQCVNVQREARNLSTGGPHIMALLPQWPSFALEGHECSSTGEKINIKEAEEY